MGSFIDFDKVKADAFDTTNTYDRDPFDNLGNQGLWQNLVKGFHAGVQTYGQVSQFRAAQKLEQEKYVLTRITETMDKVDFNDPSTVEEAKLTLARIGSAEGNWDKMDLVKDEYKASVNRLNRVTSQHDQYLDIMDDLESGGDNGIYDPIQFIEGQGGKFSNLSGIELYDALD